ncbi:glycosyltransferase [Clostridium perfringens]|nr:glycosyltransferase [Clostridium perfringens]
MRKKKILFVQETLEGGGAEKVLIDILNNFDYSKFSVDLLLLKNTGIYIKDLNKNVKKTYLYNKSTINLLDKIKDNLYKRFLIRYFSNFLLTLKTKRNYDTIISFLEGPSSQFVSKINCNAQKIAWVHTDLRQLRRSSIKDERRIYSKFNKIVCVSNEVKNGLNEMYPFTTKKSQVIYNLIDTKNIIEKSFEDIDFVFNGINLVSVGRLIESKRFDLIIKAHKNVLDRGIKQNLIILGDGPLKKELKDLTKKLGVNNSVKFLGFIDNPYPYIKKSNIYIMASEYEGLPLVICEALALKKLIISTKCTGPKEILKNGSGILVECGDYKEIANQIVRALSDKSIEEKCIEKIDEIKYLFDKKYIIKKINCLIEK